MRVRLRSGTEVQTPRAMTSRSILANQSSTWLSQEEYVGVKCSCTRGYWARNAIDPRGLVRREVAGDHMDRLSVGLVQHEVGQKKSTVTDVLNAMAVGPPGRQGPHRVVAIERLNRRLFVHADHGRVLRRVQIQADHIGRRGLNVRVVGGQVAFQAMRPEGVLGQDTRHRHVREAPQLCRSRARRPVRGPLSRRALGGPRQHFGLDPIRHFVARAPSITGEQPRQSICGKALALAINVAVAAIKLGPNLRPGQSLGPQQNQAGGRA